MGVEYTYVDDGFVGVEVLAKRLFEIFVEGFCLGGRVS